MAKTILTAAGTPSAALAGTTYYQECATCNLALGTAEANRTVVYRTAGTFSNLWVYITANATTASSTIRTRKAGSNGNQSISIGAGAIGAFEDTTNTDTVTAGQTFYYQIVVGTGGALTVGTMSIIFAATTDTVSRLAVGSAIAFATASVSRYNQLAGELTSAVGTESSTQTKARTAGTLKNLEVNVSANARTTATTVTSRKNTTNGTLTVSIGAAATGVFEDTTHTDTIAVDDLVNTVVVTGTGAETLTMQHIAVDFITTSGTGFTAYGRSGAFTQTEPLTRFPMIGGTAILASTVTESQCQVKTRTSVAFSQMTVSVTANGITDVSTLNFRKNGADGNQAISIGSSATGFFTDTTNSDVCAATDLVNLELVTPAVSGTPSITVRYFSLQYQALTTISQTNIHKYDILAYITQNSIHKYNLLQNILQSTIQKYNLLQFLQQTSIHKYALLQFAIQSSIHKYDLIANILQSSIQKYSLLQNIVQSSIQKYNVLQNIAQTSIHKYNLLQQILQQTIHKYDIIVIGAVIANSIQKYNILQYISQSNIHKYDILTAALSQVIQSSIQKYHILNVIAQASTHKYDLLKNIAQTSIHKYNILQNILQNGLSRCLK